LRLRRNPRGDVLACAKLQPASIHEREDAPVPLGVGIEPVARRARQILDNRETLAHEPVEQGRFAHIRASNDSNKRFHRDTPTFQRSWHTQSL
jgi:hypothetical protein